MAIVNFLSCWQLLLSCVEWLRGNCGLWAVDGGDGGALVAVALLW